MKRRKAKEDSAQLDESIRHLHKTSRLHSQVSHQIESFVSLSFRIQKYGKTYESSHPASSAGSNDGFCISHLTPFLKSSVWYPHLSQLSESWIMNPSEVTPGREWTFTLHLTSNCGSFPLPAIFKRFSLWSPLLLFSCFMIAAKTEFQI